jgi:AcrR family transcriptional regulator
MKSINPPLGRSRLLEVAAHIFTTEGAGAITVRRLAQDLGTSTMSLYSHFAGKDELIDATADEFVIRFGDALKSVPVTNDPLYDFVCMSHRYRSISLENRDLYKVALVSGRLSITLDVPRGIKGMFEYCLGTVARCIDTGALTIGDAQAGLMVFWTGVHGQVTLEMEQVFPSRAAAACAWSNCFRAHLIGLGADPVRLDNVFLRARSYVDTDLRLAQSDN